MKGNDRRFEPSWIDRFNNRVEKLPIRFWIFYAIFGLVLIAIQVFILWLEGGFQNGELMPVIIFNSLFTPFLLGLIHFLDQQAMTSLKTIKPALEISEADFNDYKFKLSNMPSVLPLAAGLTMLIFVILMVSDWLQNRNIPTLQPGVGAFSILGFKTDPDRVEKCWCVISSFRW